MDYKELLIKYIGHVVDCEGTNYINEYKFDNPGHTVSLTDEEKAELVKLAIEARERFNS